MASVLAVYGSTHGHTARVVERIARGLISRGHTVTTWRADRLPVHRSLDEFDGFVIAGSVRFGRHHRYLEEFIRAHAARLNLVPSALVSVSGALIGTRAGREEEAAGYIAALLASTGWRPGLTLAAAGALPYTRYGFLTRLVMKSISARTGRPTDTSRDWEFTDWDAVDRFAAQVSELVENVVAPVREPPPSGRLMKR